MLKYGKSVYLIINEIESWSAAGVLFLGHMARPLEESGYAPGSTVVPASFSPVAVAAGEDSNRPRKSPCSL